MVYPVGSLVMQLRLHNPYKETIMPVTDQDHNPFLLNLQERLYDIESCTCPTKLEFSPCFQTLTLLFLI
jgi:hypothetical protein